MRYLVSPLLLVLVTSPICPISFFFSGSLWSPSSAPASEKKSRALSTGDDLQAALNSAQPGDTILLQPGATFTGNFTLPKKNQGDPDAPQWITIATHSSALPSAGSRVSPGDAPNMAAILTPNGGAALQTEPESAYYALFGVEIGPAAGVEGNAGMVLLGDGSNNQNSLALVPHHFRIDRCYIHGATFASCKRGIGLNCASAVIENSYISEFHAVGLDSQAIAGWNGPGPFRILNNYLEGASENVLFGGADPSIPNLIPSHIKFEQNYVSKPLSWQHPILPAVSGISAMPQPAAGGSLISGTTVYYSIAASADIAGTSIRSAPSVETALLLSFGQNSVLLNWQPAPGAQSYMLYRTIDPPSSATRNWSVFSTPSTSFLDVGAAANSTTAAPPSHGDTWGIKNLFELKNAHDVLIESNIFENSWVDAQVGYAISLKSVDQDGTAPWSSTTDVTFKNNIVRNAAGAINTAGFDSENTSAQACCMSVENNLFYNIDGRAFGGGSGTFLQISAINGFSADHNTILQSGNTITVYGPNTTGFAFTNNIAPVNQYGIKGDSQGSGNATIETYFPGGACNVNVLVGGSGSAYPQTNFFPAELSDVGFVDPANNNFELLPTSPYVRKGAHRSSLGADIPTILRKTAGVQGPYQGATP